MISRAKDQKEIPLISQNGELSTKMREVIAEIFDRFDTKCNLTLDHTEFNDMLQAMELKVVLPLEFQSNICSKFCSSERGLTLKGLISYFDDFLN